MAAVLGDLESRLLAYVQLRGRSALRSEDAAEALGISATQARELLSRLARRKLIARVRRGLYLAPTKIPPGGRWSPGEFLALATLMDDRGARYQICGPAAFQRYGWDEQVPQRLDVYNTAISGRRKIGSAEFALIKVDPARLGDVDVVRTGAGIEVPYSSRARSLVDAVYDWSRFGSLPRAYQWIRDELERDPKFAKPLAESALKYGNASVIRRLGKLLELEGAAPRLLKRLEGALTESTALIPWCPTRAKRGSVDRRWGVVFNG
ncbi:MAG: type IV toxin-antitoxin system AbiEi family antitoxin domain-containing protein [Pirellulales bacterium]|nr:type IV toxin-antitoxin system AbiEi family antitoxin domain-containing protein [Pirellulales bacterium]